MKKIFFVLVSFAVLVSCQNAQNEIPPVPEMNPQDAPMQMGPASSQPGQRPQVAPNQMRPDPSSQPAPEMNREERMQQIKMQKIAYMTDELKLTVEESQAFWPIYNQWWEENMKLMGDQYSSFKEISKSDNATMADLETIALSYEKHAALVRKWGKEFAKVLPESKVAKVFVTEERFKNYLVRKGPNWNKPQK